MRIQRRFHMLLYAFFNGVQLIDSYFGFCLLYFILIKVVQGMTKKEGFN